MIKAIETEYKGYRFRSRLEARWAVLLDWLNATWEYESEGFDLGDGLYYLPDFKVCNPVGRGDRELWIEVKGNMTEEDAQKILRFAKEKSIYIVGDIPKGSTFSEIIDDMGRICYYNHPAVFNFETVDGDYFGAFPCITKDGYFELLGHDGSYLCDADTEKTVKAYFMARQARFEHGEKPLLPPPFIVDEQRERECIVRDFIEEYKHLDISYGGDKNLNHLPDIKEYYIPYLKSLGKDKWFGGTTDIQAFFREKKEYIMGEILEHDPYITEDEMLAKTHFSKTMIHKFLLKRRGI